MVLSGRDRRNCRDVRDRFSLRHVHRLRLLRLLGLLLLWLLWLLIGFSLWKGLSVAEDVVCDHAGAGSWSAYHGLARWLDSSSMRLRRWFFKQLIFTVFTRSKVIIEALVCGASTPYQRRQRSAFGMHHVATEISTLVQCLVRHLMLVHIGLNDHRSFWLILGFSYKWLVFSLFLAHDVLKVFVCHPFVFVECWTEHNLPFDRFTARSCIVVKRVWIVLRCQQSENHLIVLIKTLLVLSIRGRILV